LFKFKYKIFVLVRNSYKKNHDFPEGYFLN
jgi:hypothetical protein